MNHKIKELLEHSVIKMLEEDLENSPSVISSVDGKTIVTMKQNSTVSLLLYLHLINMDSMQTNSKETGNMGDNAYEPKSVSETMPEVGIKDINNEETEEVLQIIHDLQQKNNNFHQEIREYFTDKT
ncbi:hypothetical protein [Oceanobacillus polygoni]|uniref:Uncharacterized protein n=1 Tax=Oceanobacillus polygoni TaxID=1235259 RepID=A0A9X0YTY1_9BACI|nr:hypothetical protein [Oceanobacillus polygoni]MBP2078006.1 hypothetical protein [Oceanobacillus polygoni]